MCPLNISTFGLFYIWHRTSWTENFSCATEGSNENDYQRINNDLQHLVHRHSPTLSPELGGLTGCVDGGGWGWRPSVAVCLCAVNFAPNAIFMCSSPLSSTVTADLQRADHVLLTHVRRRFGNGMVTFQTGHVGLPVNTSCYLRKELLPSLLSLCHCTWTGIITLHHTWVI